VILRVKRLAGPPAVAWAWVRHTSRSSPAESGPLMCPGEAVGITRETVGKQDEGFRNGCRSIGHDNGVRPRPGAALNAGACVYFQMRPRHFHEDTMQSPALQDFI